MSWAEAILDVWRAGRDTVVVARGTATARAVQRDLVDAAGSADAGWPGLRVTTLGAMLNEAQPARLTAVDSAVSAPLPADQPWAEPLADRPLLRDRLAAWLDRAHALAALGDRVELSEPLARLLDAGWGRGDLALATAHLAARPPSERILAVGFEGAGHSYGGSVGRLERALLRRLGAEDVSPHGDPDADAPIAGRIACRRVADVHAEARVAAMIAQDGGPAIVLVADDATGARVRAALGRNGIPVASDDGMRIAHHAFAAALRPLAPVFEARGTAPIDVDDLERLLASPVVRRRPRLDASPASGSEDAGEPEPEPAVVDEVEGVPSLSWRRLRELLVAAGRRRLSPAAWTERLGEVTRAWESEARSDATERSARGQPTDAARAASAAARIGAARLARDTVAAVAGAAEEGTFLALARLARRLGPRGGGLDPAGLLLVRALEAGGARPVTAKAFDDALAGQASASRIDGGARILAYDDYDGRAAATLILCDVHDGGIGRLPAPDPFLTDRDRDALGLRAGAAAVRERLALARWAVRRAGRAIALATDTDASGRAVSLPVDFVGDLDVDSSAETKSHGIAIDPPTVLATRLLSDQVDLGAYAAGGPDVDATAIQIDAEWTRAGHAVGAAPAAALPVGYESMSLTELLEAMPAASTAIAPYLGWTGEGAALPDDFVLSASKLEKLAQCLYKGFAAHVLRLAARDEVTEEPDARQRGTDVHTQMEVALPGVRLRAPPALVDAERATLVGRLAVATEDALTRAPSTGNPALDAARGALAERRKAHWRRWAEARVLPVDEANRDVLDAFWKREDVKDALARATALLAGPEQNKERSKRLVKGLEALLQSGRGDVEAMLTEPAALIDELLSKVAKGQVENPERALVRASLQSPSGREALAPLGALYRSKALPLLSSSDGDDRVAATEVRLEAASGEPNVLRLGDRDVLLRGSIDALVERKTPDPDASGWLVLDHKTGHAPDADAMTQTLVAPQLALYALAVNQGLAPPPAGETPRRLPVVALAADATSKPDARPPRVAFGRAEAARAEQVFAALIERARTGVFPLSPHPLGCPLEGKAFCDAAEMCRHRARTSETGGAVEGEEAS